MKSERVLVIGANGQIGSVLVEYLRGIYGENKVIASDLREPELKTDYFEKLDATDAAGLSLIVRKHKITQIYHLAAILSANGEKEPLKTWDINMQTYFNVLEAARENGVKKIFYPSSIAVFGAHVDVTAEQYSFLDPATVYGISKAAGENWSNYYFKRYGLDIRSLRYPGIISYQSMPGGGTTDYAVDIYHKALTDGSYECFLKDDTRMPMMYMDDAIRATIGIMEAPIGKIKIRSSYNLSAMDFTPTEIADEIKKHIPEFQITYNPDFRQKIADSWPSSIDDSSAREDWAWKPEFNMANMTEDMLLHLREIYGK